MRLALLSFIATFMLLPSTSHAQGARGYIYQCGQPVRGDIDTNPGYTFCDIYQRQLNYKYSADRLRSQIKNRQHNFAEPRLRAYRWYKEDLERMYEAQRRQEKQQN